MPKMKEVARRYPKHLKKKQWDDIFDQKISVLDHRILPKDHNEQDGESLLATDENFKRKGQEKY